MSNINEFDSIKIQFSTNYHNYFEPPLQNSSLAIDKFMDKKQKEFNEKMNLVNERYEKFHKKLNDLNDLINKNESLDDYKQ